MHKILLLLYIRILEQILKIKCIKTINYVFFFLGILFYLSMILIAILLADLTNNDLTILLEQINQ